MVHVRRTSHFAVWQEPRSHVRSALAVTSRCSGRCGARGCFRSSSYLECITPRNSTNLLTTLPPHLCVRVGEIHEIGLWSTRGTDDRASPAL